MRRILVFFTSSFPYGAGETFIANELPYLEAAFDEVVIVSNDTEGEVHYELPEGVTCMRVPYELSAADWGKGLLTLLDREPREELRRIRTVYSLPITRRVRNTVLVSWVKARKFSRILRHVAEARPGAGIYAYSYWANDMALAVAVARSRGWVHVAVCRAHRWDVYFERSAAGVLPFRRYLAENLDHYRFVSKDGFAYFRAREGRDYPSLGVSNLGTEPIGGEPLANREPFVLISCSKMIPRKRVERIAEALALVRRPVTWIHIGDGPSRSSVERIVSRLPRSIRVELTGTLSNAEVLDTYRERRPSLFVSLSDSEGMPVAIMEAMSAGVPVVATAVGGIPEFVSHRENGLLLDPDPDVADVGSTIEAFADMPEAEYRTYARAAWTTWNVHFNAEVNYPRFLTDVLGRRQESEPRLGIPGT
jgi:colanic acid/amylovoran biosynthesis glycosyltransferase